MHKSVLGIRHTGCPVSELSAEFPSVNQQHFSRVEQAEGKSRRLLRVDGDGETVDEFLAAFSDHEGVRRLERVSTSDDGRTVYCSLETQYQPDNPSILQLVKANSCHFHPTVTVQAGVEHWVLFTMDKTKVTDVVADVERHGNVLNMYRTMNMSRSGFGMNGLMTLLTRLTERQREAMEAALTLGYYDDRSDVTLEEIAAALDVHETTAWEHLSKAENSILSEVGERLF